MTPGQYKASLDQAVDLLRESGLIRLAKVGQKPVSEAFIEVSRKEDYRLKYQTAVDNGDFDVLLDDEALIQFNYEKRQKDIHASYSYYEWPYDFPTYKKWLADAGFSYDDVLDAFIDEYQEDLSKAPLKQSFTPIRYDHSRREYVAGLHPISHLHVGCSNSIRIPICHLITPYMFTLLIMKQIYYNEWKDLRDREIDLLGYLRKSRSSCTQLKKDVFCDLDKCELYLV